VASPGADWVFWYLRATTRELGSPAALLDGGYQRRLLAATRGAEIDAEIAWHRDMSKGLSRLQLLLLQVSEACFLSTGVLLAIFLALFTTWAGLRVAIPVAGGGAPSGLGAWEERLWHFLAGARPFVTVLATLLPAAGGAIAGLRLAAGFERGAERSGQAASLLRALKSDYAAASERLELDKTATTLLETARAQAETIDACRKLYGRRRLTLPV